VAVGNAENARPADTASMPKLSSGSMQSRGSRHQRRQSGVVAGEEEGDEGGYPTI